MTVTINANMQSKSREARVEKGCSKENVSESDAQAKETGHYLLASRAEAGVPLIVVQQLLISLLGRQLS